MWRAAISSAKEASLSALPLASLVAVREHSRWIAARITMSGSGTRSTAPIIEETKLIGSLLSAAAPDGDRRLQGENDPQNPANSFGRQTIYETRVGLSPGWRGSSLCCGDHLV